MEKVKKPKPTSEEIESFKKALIEKGMTCPVKYGRLEDYLCLENDFVSLKISIHTKVTRPYDFKDISAEFEIKFIPWNFKFFKYRKEIKPIKDLSMEYAENAINAYSNIAKMTEDYFAKVNEIYNEVK